MEEDWVKNVKHVFIVTRKETMMNSCTVVVETVSVIIKKRN